MFGLGKRKTQTLIGKGIDLYDRKNRVRKIWLKDEERKGHLFCFGTTRIGKTKLAESMICQDIEKGYSVVLVDPKGDISFFSKIVQTAFATGREKELCLITSIYPESSAIIDRKLTAVIPGIKDSFSGM